MSQLKEREQKILSYMKEEIRTKGYPPTVREICAALGIKSTSTAHKDIESLVKQGYLVKDPSKPRALMVVDPVSGPSGQWSRSGKRHIPVERRCDRHTCCRPCGCRHPYIG